MTFDEWENEEANLDRSQIAEATRKHLIVLKLANRFPVLRSPPTLNFCLRRLLP
jgi:hypothetical protein